MQFSNIPTFVLFVCFHLLLSIKINKDIGEYRQLSQIVDQKICANLV